METNWPSNGKGQRISAKSWTPPPTSEVKAKAAGKIKAELAVWGESNL